MDIPRVGQIHLSSIASTCGMGIQGTDPPLQHSKHLRHGDPGNKRVLIRIQTEGAGFGIPLERDIPQAPL